MNKRNTTFAIILLVVLVVFLAGRSVFRHRSFVNFSSSMDTMHELEQFSQNVEALDSTVHFDLNVLQGDDVLMVIHYPKMMHINGSYVRNHVIGGASDVSSLEMPDTLDAIHVYPVFKKQKVRKVMLGVYNKIHLSQTAEYRVTYPVTTNDSVRVVSDVGTVSAEMSWKFTGFGNVKSMRKQAEEDIVKLLEQSLMRDIKKKMEPSETL